MSMGCVWCAVIRFERFFPALCLLLLLFVSYMHFRFPRRDGGANNVTLSIEVGGNEPLVLRTPPRMEGAL